MDDAFYEWLGDVTYDKPEPAWTECTPAYFAPRKVVNNVPNGQKSVPALVLHSRAEAT